MKKITNNQSGFGAVEIVLIIVIVGLLAGLGYMFYKGQKKAPVTVTPTSNASSSTSNKASGSQPQAATNSPVTLGGKNYSFTAPSDWKAASGAPGDFYQNSKGELLIVGEDQALGTPTADFMWQANLDTSKGIIIVDKSPACKPGNATFSGISYVCNEDSSTTKVNVFMAAQGGEVLLGNNHKYVISYTSPVKPGGDLSSFQTILGTFKAK